MGKQFSRLTALPQEKTMDIIMLERRKPRTKPLRIS
jgi:hypothetical protein